MNSRGAALILLLALASGAARGDDAEALEVQVELDRAEVFVHEQVVLAVRVRHPAGARASWEPPPFDGFWAERLGTRGLAPDERGRPSTEFRRALFPTRTGLIEIDDSRLLLAGEGGAERAIRVPGAELRVRALPSGVPDDALVGRLEVRAALGDDRLRLGKAVSLTIELSGEGNVWDAAPPALEPLVGDGVEVFPEPPLLSIGESAGRATTRRTFRYALVPARAGQLRIEPVRFSYFDPQARALAIAASAPQLCSVFAGSSEPEERTPWTERAKPREAAPIPLAGVALATALALAASAAYLVRWRRAQLAGLPEQGAPSPRMAFDAALAARDTAECLPHLARAVRAGIGVRHGFDASPLTSAEIAARSPDPEALELLRELERARFAGRARADDEMIERVRAHLRL